MSMSNDFDETFTHGGDMFHGSIIDDLTIVTINFTTADNNECTLDVGTDDLKKDTGVHTNLYSCQV